MDLELQGRTYIVTGGSSGIGLAVTRALVAEGASVATCARENARLRDAVASLGAGHRERVSARAGDVRDAAAMEDFVEAAVQEFGAIHGIVNNAGQSSLGTFETTTNAAWKGELDLKISSVVNLVTPALPALRRVAGAAIVNINAVLARQPEAHLVATSAARAAVLNLSKSLATEFAGDGIRVNSVCLGLIDTGQWRRRWESADTSTSFEKWCARVAAERGVPMGRFGTADEVADVVLFLLSGRASYVTGAVVDVSGGLGRYV